ncbi:MAG: mevalonate kinase [Nanoarchaeota archaeon]|nr:mevalonate kinase [Nanoarchaeota archaeon]
MPRSCGKIILFGEHSVVYGKPAIAVPVKEVFTEAIVEPSPVFKIVSDFELKDNENVLLKNAIDVILFELGIKNTDFLIRINSTLPVGRGMGSSASISISIIKALSLHIGIVKSENELNRIAYECEKVFHGTPSGIDNTVIAYEKPVHFIKGENIEFLNIKMPFTLLIAGTGKKKHGTKEIVADVRKGYEKNKEQYSAFFEEMGNIALSAKDSVTRGDIQHMGRLMDMNHEYLQKIGVSSKGLDRLVKAAKNAGALGAKLVGAGRGGNMVALVDKENKEEVRQALLHSGAVGIIETLVR